MGREQKHLADEFFKKTKDQAVDFEITLAALLATACLTYPLPRFWLSQIIAFGLLTVTLIRRIAIASPFASEEKIMGFTTRIVEFFTTIAIISLFIVLGSKIDPIVGLLNPIQTFSILAIGISLSLVLAQELAFRDYFVWWTAKFQEKRKNADHIEGFWQDLEEISYWLAEARKNRDSWNRIPASVKNDLPDPSDFEFEPKKWAKFSLRTFLILGLIYGLPVGYAVWRIGFSGLLVVPAVVAIHDHSCFWYVAYGNTSYEEFRKPIPEIAFWTVTYIILVEFLIDSSFLIGILLL